MDCGCGGLMNDCFCSEDEYGESNKMSNYEDDLTKLNKLLEKIRALEAENLQLNKVLVAAMIAGHEKNGPGGRKE